ncbi:FUSC family protein [Acetobacter okinawensis]|uniref:FUSC family protein n=1 Tax=Acetobacter okinawensis TaxID=1076594 RepID=UPI001BAC2A4D|nr:FUSC family protein [Acetobacter okinawensis]MBS0989226.1 FUSC family protein [Acetobacter okinawensis]
MSNMDPDASMPPAHRFGGAYLLALWQALGMQSSGKLKWLLAPSWGDVAFAVRSAFAAGLSLVIAMGMEMDSPQWAPLTVWVVAQSSRGESLSKARWRIAGTVLGCCVAVELIAALPQSPALFFGVLACWIGLCCGMATFLEGYKAYGLVLTGFTSAIVATGAIMQPDQVFDIALSRGTYIVLGVVCEALLALLFMPGLHARARARLKTRLDAAQALVRKRVDCLVEGHPTTELDQSPLLGELTAAGSRIEYDALEAGGYGHMADHARAALAGLLVLLARAEGLATLKLLPADKVPTSICKDEWAVREHVEACLTHRRGDHFRFRIRSRRHALEAVENGVRACAGILVGWLLWEVTAWPSGPTFMSLLALVYGLLATRENPVVASAPFFRGAVWCVLVAGVYVTLVLPALNTPEMLVLLMMVPMVIGGLAARNPATAGYAFSFNMFLPVLMGPNNQGRYDEVSFLNASLAFLGAVLVAGWTYRTVLPFRPDSHMLRTARWSSRRLQGLASANSRVSVYQWLSGNADSLVRIMRNAQGIALPRRNAFARQQFSGMVSGMHVILLRELALAPTTPPAVQRALRAFLRHWEHDDGVMVTRQAASTARWLERQVAHMPPQQQEIFEHALVSLRLLACAQPVDLP